jgi:hypothetical protein
MCRGVITLRRLLAKQVFILVWKRDMFTLCSASYATPIRWPLSIVEVTVPACLVPGKM